MLKKIFEVSIDLPQCDYLNADTVRVALSGMTGKHFTVQELEKEIPPLNPTTAGKKSRIDLKNNVART